MNSLTSCDPHICYLLLHSKLSQSVVAASNSTDLLSRVVSVSQEFRGDLAARFWLRGFNIYNCRQGGTTVILGPLGVGDLFPRWLTNMAGKLMVAVGRRTWVLTTWTSLHRAAWISLSHSGRLPPASVIQKKARLEHQCLCVA